MTVFNSKVHKETDAAIVVVGLTRKHGLYLFSCADDFILLESGQDIFIESRCTKKCIPSPSLYPYAMPPPVNGEGPRLFSATCRKTVYSLLLSSTNSRSWRERNELCLLSEEAAFLTKSVFICSHSGTCLCFQSLSAN